MAAEEEAAAAVVVAEEAARQSSGNSQVALRLSMYVLHVYLFDFFLGLSHSQTHTQTLKERIF